MRMSKTELSCYYPIGLLGYWVIGLLGYWVILLKGWELLVVPLLYKLVMNAITSRVTNNETCGVCVCILVGCWMNIQSSFHNLHLWMS